MINLSLARIMYGTNEDYHAAISMSARAIPSLGSPSTARCAERESAASSTFGSLLERAWALLHHKD